MPRSIVVHGHYYQPPREDPWLDEIERQPTAAPFHDWNARIEHESYRAVVAARVLDKDGRIARVINALAWTSFDFGPTLLAWLEREAPATYDAVRDADRRSAARLHGHGNAIAQSFHHTILPLASRRDKTTEVRWGIADFARRFGRQPEGLWLPETAVDDETLDVLAAEGIRFTVLASHQVVGAPPQGMPGLYRTENGREIALFVYDGPMSHGIAFGGLLNDASGWARRLTTGLTDDTPELIAAAADGETFGHHHRFGEMALAALIDTLERDDRVQMENFASFLSRHPAIMPVTIVAPTSWSCAHGVERWRRDCGCGSTVTSPSQAWRAPLRHGVEQLATGLHEVFESEAPAFFPDPWAARDAYGSPAFVSRSTSMPVRARELLELERNALRLYTSCAWFFDDIDRLEPLQIMRYAARGIELAGSKGTALETEFLSTLAKATSNDPRSGSGRDIYLAKAKPAHSPFAAIVVAQAVARASGVVPPRARSSDIEWHGERVIVRERITGREHPFDVRIMSTGTDDDGALRRARALVIDVHPVDASAPARAGQERIASNTLSGPAAPTSGTVRLTIDDAQDTDRAAILTAVRRGVFDRALDASDQSQLASGAALDDVLPNALLRAVIALAEDRGPAAVARVLDLADLADDVGMAPSYDVQTAFARVHGELAAAPMRLAPVARRLGFSPPERPVQRAVVERVG